MGEIVVKLKREVGQHVRATEVNSRGILRF